MFIVSVVGGSASKALRLRAKKHSDTIIECLKPLYLGVWTLRESIPQSANLLV